MGIYEDVMIWLSKHNSVRTFLRDFAVATIGVVLAYQTVALGQVPPEWAGVIVVIFAGLSTLRNYLKYNTDAPIVGQKSKIAAANATGSRKKK